MGCVHLTCRAPRPRPLVSRAVKRLRPPAPLHGGMDTILEGARQVPVRAEADVVVAGGGPAGVAAAVGAARAGAKTLLVERFGYLGGQATGGLVLCLVETDRYGFGVCRELIERLTSLQGAARKPPAPGEKAEWTEGASFSGCEVADFDPELYKCVAGELVHDAGARLLLHTFLVGSVVENGAVKAVITESKAGREAIRGKAFVDATGDADIAAFSGAPFHLDRHPWGINLDFRLGGVDVSRALQWRREHRDRYEALMRSMEQEAGGMGWDVTTRPDVVWGGSPHFHDVDGLSPADLTRVEVEGRRLILKGLEFLRRNMPGFESAFLLDTATQPGVRETRRIVGEYTLTKVDVLEARRFEDAVVSSIFDIPLRCLVPQRIEGLLASGRCISITHEAHGTIRNIPPCMAIGQAAGVAAALAAQTNTAPRRLDVPRLQRLLAEQGVPVPGVKLTA